MNTGRDYQFSQCQIKTNIVEFEILCEHILDFKDSIKSTKNYQRYRLIEVNISLERCSYSNAIDLPKDYNIYS